MQYAGRSLGPNRTFRIGPEAYKNNFWFLARNDVLVHRRDEEQSMLILGFS